MKSSIALLAGIPCDPISAQYMFENIRPGSFADEWRFSRPNMRTQAELVESYISVVVQTWNDVVTTIRGKNTIAIPNATSSDLVSALQDFDVTIILAHHVEEPDERPGGLEFLDRIVDQACLCAIAPVRPSVVHLGVCRSVGFMDAFKARCSDVRVIASQIGVEPEFFLRSVAATIQLCGQEMVDYIHAHVRVRFAMLDALRG